MSKRTRDWDIGLADDLQNPSFAREFLLAAVEEEGISLQEAIAKVIRSYGIKEFSARINMPSSNLSRAIDMRHNPTQETLNKLLEPFGLMVGVKPISESSKKVA